MNYPRKTLTTLAAFAFVALYAALVAILAMPLLGQSRRSEPLRLDQTDLRQGILGQPLTLTLDGSGFDDETRFSLILDSGNQQAIVDRIETFGSVYTILRDGSALYLGIRARRVHQFALPNADHPEFLRKYSLPDHPTSLLRHRGQVWVATGAGKVARLDRSDQPSPPRLCGVIAQIATDEDGTLYVAAGKQGLMIFRPPTDQVNPKPLGVLKLPGTILNVLVAGKLALLGGIRTGLHLCDLRDPSAPKRLATLPLTEIIQDIALRDHLAILATTEGLVVVDIADPRHPSVLSRLPLGKLYKVAIEGNRALVAAGAGGLLVVDLARPEQPRITGHLTPGDSVHCLTVNGERAYLGTENAGLLVVDLKRLHGHPEWRPRPNPVPYPITLGARHAPLTDNQLATLTTAVKRRLPANCDIQSLACDATTAYFGAECGLAIASLRNPEKVRLLRQPLTCVGGIWLSGATAYVAGAKPSGPPDNLHKPSAVKGLQIFDLGDPRQPRAQGFIKTDHPVQQVLIDRDRAYLVMSKRGITMVDIGDPTRPRPLGTIELPWPERHFANYHRIYLRDDVLYIACGRAGLQIFDVGDPTAPRCLGAINTPGGWITRLAGQNDQLFIQNFNNDLQLYDIGAPRSPRLTGTLDRFSGTQAIDIHDGKLRMSFSSNLRTERALPLVAEKVDPRSSAQVELVFPAPAFAGDYRLYAFNRQGRQRLPGVIHIAADQK